MFQLRQETLISFLAFAMLFVAGNAARADDKVGGVQGKVTFKGQPLADGKIIFHLDNGQFVGCKIKNGDYKIDQVPCGTRKVSVEAKGIPAAEIKPRENVFTFGAWRALGRTVRRGEHGVKVETWVEREVTDPDDPEKHYQTRHHRRTTVFHISQTELLHPEFPQQRDLPPDNSGK